MGFVEFKAYPALIPRFGNVAGLFSFVPRCGTKVWVRIAVGPVANLVNEFSSIADRDREEIVIRQSMQGGAFRGELRCFPSQTTQLSH